MIGIRDPATWGGDPWQSERAEAINRSFEYADEIPKPIAASRDLLPGFDSAKFWETRNEPRPMPDLLQRETDSGTATEN